MPPAPRLVADFFDRPDGPLATDWTVPLGGYAIHQGAAETWPRPGLHVALRLDVATADQTVRARFTCGDVAQGPRFGLLLRYQDPLNFLTVYRQAGGSPLVRIAEVVNGREQVLRAARVANPTPHVPFALEAEALGAAVSLTLNQVQLAAAVGQVCTGAVGFFVLTPGASTVQHRVATFAAEAG